MNTCENGHQPEYVPDIYLGESQYTQQDLYTTGLVCSVCGEILSMDVSEPEEITEDDWRD